MSVSLLWNSRLVTFLSTKMKSNMFFSPGHHVVIVLFRKNREQDKESDKLALLSEVDRHRRQMLSNQTAWKKANLASELSLDNLVKESLLYGGDSKFRQRKVTKEGLAQTSNDITESLVSISQMMSQQFGLSSVATSSQAVLETNDEFKAMTGIIQLGRKLTDKLLIFLTLVLFLTTVFYILKKRLFIPFLRLTIM
uniref:BCL2 interacting protein 1 n=1 Tax=Hucho hucho TaxID=62062 RepID=A0A4W5LEP6_9TELE